MTQPRSVAIIGFLTAGAVILGLGFCLGGEGDGRGTTVAPLRIVDPADGDSLRNPIVLTFRTPATLRLDPSMGWMAHDLHLHAMADTIEIMPAASDITALNDSTWRWRLPPLTSGSRRIHLTWAGRHHGNLRGEADTIRVHVLP
jgi:hypothetical protein